ncbi:MAG: PAS domain S-box-containing protein [Acidimicrobiales bacterium]|jgi:PAS domain S-box-containing protein
MVKRRTETDLSRADDVAGIEIAVLDHAGVIESVNSSWERFSEQNGGDPTRTGVGVSYLDICDQAEDESGAAEVSAAIRRALAGNLASTEVIRIPCDSESESRWFDVLISARPGLRGDVAGVTVVLTPAAGRSEPADIAGGLVPPEGLDLRAATASKGSQPLSDVPAADGAMAWAMVEASPDALVMADEDGLIELVNGQAEKLFGYDRIELLGKPVEMLLPERFVGVHRAHRTRFRVAPEVRAMGSGMDLRARRADGTEIPVEVSLSPLRAQGRLRVIAAVRDISDRAAAEAAAQRVRAGLDSIVDGVYMFDPETLRFSYVNDGAVAQTGYSAAEMVDGMTPLHLTADFSRDQFARLVAGVVGANKGPSQFEATMCHRSGRDFPVEVVMACPDQATDLPPVVLAVVRDISLRRSAERQAGIIRHSIDAVSDAVFVCDEHTLEFIHVNQGAVELHGYEREELLAGMTPGDLAPDMSADDVGAALTKLADAPLEHARFAATGITKDETVVPVEVLINWPLPAQPGDPRPVIAVVRDISDRVAAEAQSRRRAALDRTVSQVRLAMLQGASRGDGLRLICEGANEALDASAVMILTPTGADDDLSIEADIGLSRSARASMSFRTSQGVVGEVFTSGQPQFTDRNDQRISPANLAVAEQHDAGSIVAAPIHDANEVVGVVVVVRAGSAPRLDDEDLVAVEQFASAAVVAIEAAEARENQTQLELFEDRERIGRDMHDKVIGRLFATGMALQSTLGRVADPATASRLSDMVEEIDVTIKEIRTTIYGARSQIGWGKGVAGQILAIAADQNAILGFEPRVTCIGPIDDLSEPTVDELTGTLHEALTNIGKHAQATTATIDVLVADNDLTVTITDNGKGFDPAAVTRAYGGSELTSNGLVNMTTRAEKLGGHATISSNPGEGTMITWTVPFRGFGVAAPI